MTIGTEHDPDYVSGLPPKPPSPMSKDAIGGYADSIAHVHRGMCRHCGAELPVLLWAENGRCCMRCKA